MKQACRMQYRWLTWRLWARMFVRHVDQAAFVVLSTIVPISGSLRVELEGRSSITYKFGRADQLNKDPTKDGR